MESASGKEEEERAFNCFKCDFKSDEMEEVVLHVLRHRRKKEARLKRTLCPRGLNKEKLTEMETG